MKKEVNQQYLLALDIEDEVRSAIAEASSGSSLDRIIEEEPAKGIEAAVAETPVLYSGNSANYRTDTAELPDNYKNFGGKAADDDDDEPEVSYAFVDAGQAERAAAQDYEKETDEKIKADTLKISNAYLPKSAEAAERLENYKISIGFAMRFLLYAIKSAVF